jgi:single-stranded DNA-binding protein
VTWGKLSEQCAKYLQKGAPAHVEGTLRARKYEAKPGEERTIYEIHAEEVRFLPRAKATTDAESPAELAPLVM